MTEPVLVKKRIIILAASVLFLSSFQDTEARRRYSITTPRPKNIILMIGDGMGLTQITAALYANGNSLNIEHFPVTGLIKTHSAKHIVTDSGAGATAFACGCKTFNGAIGVCKDKTPCQTILELADINGLATGLIATSSITHATPASFIAHVPDRSDMQAIATFFLQTNIDLFVGGGLKYFNQRNADQRNLVEELIAKDYYVTDFSTIKLSDIKPPPERPFAWFSADDEPESVTKGRDYLPVAARMAPDFLKKRSEKGFFLMIEGSQIDWACHAKNAANTVSEVLDFDAAIGEVLKFAEMDGNTLVIITADHETGGMALEQGRGRDSLDMEFVTAHHTATLVPVFAYGPGAEYFNGVYDNTDIYVKMKELFGFTDVVEEKLKSH
jgi:alkaline phosphatase